MQRVESGDLLRRGHRVDRRAPCILDGEPRRWLGIFHLHGGRGPGTKGRERPPHTCLLLAALAVGIAVSACTQRSSAEENGPTQTSRASSPAATVGPTVWVRPTARPSRTPESTPRTFEDVPRIDASITYALVRPNPDVLLSIFEPLGERYWDAVVDPDQWRGSALHHEAAAVNALIAADIERYYPAGVPEGSTYVERPVASWRGLTHYPADALYLVLQKGILQYLRDHEILVSRDTRISTDGFEATVAPLDLRPTAVIAWLLRVEFGHYGFTIHLPVEQLADGSYGLLPNNFPVFPSDMGQDVETSTAHDLTGDAHRDVAISYQSYFAGSVSGSVGVYSWDGQAFRHVGQAALPSVAARYGEGHSSEYAIGDFDGDARPEIRVTQPRFYPFGCHWVTITSYRWVGERKIVTSINEQVPSSPSCYLAQALLADDFSQRAEWLDSFLDLSETYPASSDLRAWARLQLAVTYAGLGRDDEAEAMLVSLADTNGREPFLRSVRETIRRVGPSAVDVCGELAALAQEMADSGDTFGSDIDEYLAPGGYPIGDEPSPLRVCPYWDLWAARVETLSIPAGRGPVADLAASGYSFGFVHPLNIDGDEETEWIGLLDVGRPMLVLLNSLENAWQIHAIGYTRETPLDLEAVPHDVNNDGLRDVLVVVTMPGSSADVYGDACQPESDDYQLIIVWADWALGFSHEGRVLICQAGPAPDIATDEGAAEMVALVEECEYCALLSATSTAVPDWVSLEGLPHEAVAEDVFSYLDQLRHRVLHEAPRNEVRRDLQRLADYLAGEELAEEILLPEIVFMMALSYELDTQEPEAIARYVALVAEAPSGPWAWLAWARLQPAITER